MANSNPIKKSEPDSYSDFEIPAEHAAKKLSISTETTLDKTGWQLDLLHSLVAKGKSLNPPAGDLDQVELGTCSDLADKKMRLASTISRIKDTGSNPPPGASYKLTFFVDDEELESFSIKASGTIDRLFTKIKFVIK